MSLTRAVAAVKEQRGADPTLPWGSSVIPTNGQLGFVAAGVPINDDAALSIDTVASCIRLIVDTVSALPLIVLKNTKVSAKAKILDAPPLIQNPWPEGTLQDWITQVVMSLALRGNFYGQIIDRDPAGYPQTIMPVHPDDVNARRGKDGKRYYKFNNQPIPLADVFHIPGPMLPPGGFVALNPVEYRRQSWALAAAAEKYGGQFFGNSATPSGILSTEQELSEDETLEWARQWKQQHGGLGMAQTPAILTGGAKFQQISIAPDDAQFLQTRSFQREQIISWFGIPPHKIGITDKTPTSGQIAEDLEIAFMQDAIMPYTRRIENYLSLSNPPITRPSQKIQFDFTERMRPNSLQRAQVAQIQVNTGQWMIDEARAWFDMEPLPNNLGRVIGRPMNNSYFDVDSGDMLNQPDPTLEPPNPGGLADGGGNPANAKLAAVTADEVRALHELVAARAPVAPDVRVEAPHVEVAAPHVEVAAPNVEVAAPHVEVAAPTVNVQPADVRVNVDVPTARRVRRVVHRDKRGRIDYVEDEDVTD